MTDMKFLFITILFSALLFGGVARAEDGMCLCNKTDVKTKIMIPAQPVKLTINNEANCIKKNGEKDVTNEYSNCAWIPASKPPTKPAGATSPTAPSAPAGPGVSAPAGTSAMPEETKLINPIGGKDEPGGERGLVDMKVLLGNIIKAGLGIIGSLTLVVFIYGGFLWLISAGNQEQVKKGMQTMLWAVIGIFIIFASYGILTLVLNAIGATGAIK